jgi:predicted SprT family Zn-dependent metalloprotease
MVDCSPDLKRRIVTDADRIASFYGMRQRPHIRISNRLRRDAARSYPDRNLVVINAEYAAANASVYRHVRETVAHEIAHIAAGYDVGHGPRWASLMRRAGEDPDVGTGGTEHNSPPHYAHVCAICGDALFRFGKPHRPRRCPTCGRVMQIAAIDGSRLQKRWEEAIAGAGCRPQQMETCGVKMTAVERRQLVGRSAS